jgi:hypothetical protein
VVIGITRQGAICIAVPKELRVPRTAHYRRHALPQHYQMTLLEEISQPLVEAISICQTDVCISHASSKRRPLEPSIEASNTQRFLLQAFRLLIALSIWHVQGLRHTRMITVQRPRPDVPVLSGGQKAAKESDQTAVVSTGGMG